MSRKKCIHNENSLGGRLRSYRQLKRLQLVEFSKLLGISHSSLSAIENNKTKPSSDTYEKLSSNTDINLSWLLTGEGEINQNTAPSAVVKSPEIPYKSQPGKTDALLQDARKVLTSGNRFAEDALERNIRYFSHAVDMEKKLKTVEDAEQRLQDMEKQFQSLKKSIESIRQAQESCKQDIKPDMKKTGTAE